MTTEEMRVAIANSRGWSRGKRAESSFCDPSKTIYNDCWIDSRGIDCRKLPDFCEDLNVILPLLPVNIVIVRYERDWNVRGNDPAYHSARNPSLALAACEFYLKSKNLWKD